MQQLDGATIKRVIDDWGRTPQPYAGPDGATVYPPAYQQVLKGLPAVNYAARDIMYRPRNVRAHRVYGYSPVQQILMTVNIAGVRWIWPPALVARLLRRRLDPRRADRRAAGLDSREGFH